MTRSVWKGPFVDGYLLKKAEAARSSSRNEVIKIWSRRRFDIWCPQWSQIYPRTGYRGYGWSQIW